MRQLRRRVCQALSNILVKRHLPAQTLNSCVITAYSCAMQSHNACVTETQKYVEGATKAGGSAAAGFFDNGSTPQSVGDAAGAQYLSKRPPWKCSICSVSCTSESTLVAHASGTKHKRRVRAADAAASTTGAAATPAPAIGVDHAEAGLAAVRSVADAGMSVRNVAMA